MQAEIHDPPRRITCGAGRAIVNASSVNDRPYPVLDGVWADIDKAVESMRPSEFQPHDVHGLAAWIPLALPGCRIVVAFVTYDREWREPFAHAFCEIHGA